ncbi:MAG: hypothetical protein KJ970_16010 [Candidatus Eisenbacteria bacterium]|uniref:Outer membrane protein beta-barrel domain-containing protein n=1 Tax=Eiseniibacteriota bacterium TaxID=2212470 RepID=A0A948RZG8_UNCEI|nr:hypothetical protein [Candidatus Eisenbacteria bacterium]MBU1948802.1 hypothetical protein [Candidatus Eisenbacteria bacterium]MBU2692429.1 hypothetical protein [Candidatus Eisenbacteria bacterium]
MKKYWPLFGLVFVLVSAVISSASATEGNIAEEKSVEPPVLLKGRHGITIFSGLLNQTSTETDISHGNVNTDTRVNGFLGSISYNHWARKDWAVCLSAGVITAETSTSVEQGEVESKSAAVLPLLFGLAYYPEKLALSPPWRPYASIAVGPYIGSATNSIAGETVGSKTVSEAVLGLRIQAGMDFFFSKRFKAGVVAGYHFVGEYEEQIGADTDYSGPEFSICFGILLGSGKD